MQATQILSPDAFYWSIGQACKRERIPVDIERVRRRFPPPLTAESFVLAATELGLRAGIAEIEANDLTPGHLPCFAIFNPADNGAQLAGMIAQLIAREEGSVTVLDPLALQTEERPWADFIRAYSGRIIRVTAASDPEPGASVRSRASFGLGWFVPELLKHRRIWRDVLVASLAIQLAALAAPLCTQVIIDKVVVHQTSSTLLVVAIALLILMLFSASMGWIRQYLVLHTGTRIDAVLGSKVFEHLLGLPVRYFEQRPTGTVVARLQAVETIREFLSGAAAALLLDLPFMLVFVAIMFWYSPLLSLIVLAAMALMVLLGAGAVPAIRGRLNSQFLAGARAQAFITEHVAGMETVKSLQMEPRLKLRYNELLARCLATSFSARQLSGTYGVLAGLVEQLMMLAVLVAGAWMVMQNEGFTIGMLVAFQLISSRLSQPLMRVAALWQEFQQTAVAVQRLGDVMDAPIEPDALLPTRPAPASVTIEFCSVSFRHAENLPYLYREFNFRLDPGECVALMGPSGCGKSTLARLLLGTYMPSDGRILVNGCDTRGMPVSELRVHFGVVLQDARLFSGTLHENLTAGNPLADTADIVRACQLAEIHSFIEQLPEGYQTRIGECGAGLSGGQRQRIAIARALLRQPRALIFDEAGSNLDATTADQLGSTISRLKGVISVLFIAQQLPASLQVDRVVSIGGAST